MAAFQVKYLKNNFVGNRQNRLQICRWFFSGNDRWFQRHQGINGPLLRPAEFILFSNLHRHSLAISPSQHWQRNEPGHGRFHSAKGRSLSLSIFGPLI